MIIPGFRAILHGGDYNPDQWLSQPEVIDEDFRLFEECGCNTFTVGVFAWSRLEPTEGVYDFGWLDSILDRMAGAGKNVILATPSGAKPFWLSERYDEVRRINREGNREFSGMRHNHCWSSPVYRIKVLGINTLLAQRYGRHPAVKMWHVSNEFNGECFCPLCVSRFQEWLEKRYGNLDALNAAYWSDFWAHRFSCWTEINPRDWALDGLTLDWRRFASWQVEDFFEWEAAPLREHSPGVPVLTNLMGFFEGVDYHRLAGHLDIVADDSYPGYDADSPDLVRNAAMTALKFDMMRCLKGEPRPWFLMESCIDGRQIWSHLRLKVPGLHHLEMFQALAHGADGTLYFQWRKGRGGVEKYHGAVVHHTHARETRSFREVSALSRRYESLAGILDSSNRSEVALLLDWESRWGYRASKGLPGTNDPSSLIAHAADHYLPLWRRGISVDVLSSRHDFSSYRLLIVPRLYLLQPGFAVRLREFVQKGGTVLLTALSGMVNKTNLCWTDGCPGDGLEQLSGVWMEETGEGSPHAELRVASQNANALGIEGTWKVGNAHTRIHLRGAKTVLSYANGWLRGTPALTARAAGNGRTFYLAADLEQSGLDAIYEALSQACGLASFYRDGSALPPGVSVQTRRSESTVYRYFLNFSGETQTVRLPHGHHVNVESKADEEECVVLAPWEAKVLATSAGS